MSNLPISITLILAISTLIAAFLYLREYFLRKKGSEQVQKTTLETRQKSIQLLNAAQMAETEILSQGNFVTQKLISEFKTQLQNLVQSSETSITLSQNQLVHFFEELQKRGTKFEETSKSATEQRIDQLFERLETRMSDFLIQTEQKTTASIDLELKATRELIETYKSQQLKLIDENIVAMMEQTINIVLGKKLSLQNQLELVYEALEKAKIEKFVI